MKTMLLVISKASQLKFLNLNLIPKTMREKVNFVLIINENLYKSMSNTDLEIYNQVIPVQLNILNEMEAYFIQSDLEKIFTEITMDNSEVFIFTTDEVNLDVIEKAAANTGIPYWNKQTALYCRDKTLMKEHMQKHKIRAPKFIRFLPNLSFTDFEAQLRLPFVLKPVDGFGSGGFFLINTFEDYTTFLEKYDSTQAYQAEEYIEGTLYHIDTVKYNDVMLTTVAEYVHPLGEFMDGKVGGSMELLPGDKYYTELIEFNRKVIASYDNNGCYHHEVFVNKFDEIIFLEIGWRQSGAPVDNIFTQHYGIPQTILFMMLHIDSQINPANLKYTGEYSLRFYIPRKLGIYHGLNLPKLNGGVEIENIITPGTEVILPPQFYSDIAAILVLKYPSMTIGKNDMREDFITLRNIDL